MGAATKFRIRCVFAYPSFPPYLHILLFTNFIQAVYPSISVINNITQYISTYLPSFFPAYPPIEISGHHRLLNLYLQVHVSVSLSLSLSLSRCNFFFKSLVGNMLSWATSFGLGTITFYSSIWANLPCVSVHLSFHPYIRLYLSIDPIHPPVHPSTHPSRYHIHPHQSMSPCFQLSNYLFSYETICVAIQLLFS